MDALTPATSIGLLLAKVLALVLVASTLACSASLDDDGEDDDAKTSAARATTSDPSQLDAHLDAGDYVATITSTALDCRAALGGQATIAAFAAPSGTPDAGLTVDLTIVGDLGDGAAITADNARADRGFELDVTTPRGVAYRYRTLAPDAASARAGAALVKVRGGSFFDDYRLSLQGLAASQATPDAAPLTLTALVHCAHAR
jgi:hypothetical protein